MSDKLLIISVIIAGLIVSLFIVFNNNPISKTVSTFMTDINRIKIPNSFPKDIPIYPNAKVETLSIKKSQTLLVLISKDSPTQINNFYALEIKKYGWTYTSKDINFYASTKEHRELFVSISKLPEEINKNGHYIVINETTKD
ncbi:hypothetical protein A3J90_00430 [candidate division WOR-1 bacterium RIFOXYC2_FULL_37_10]|uniref:Uncharacterized protein n=1 Tax=candidate division WOR-1 bacterium RIFOXYB2_FULL_37_13 TaxID=1802579 RepID=A0A1F4SMS5_UNCSA|nr:MAG: hypothetical protein A2310_00315 [candidate division WOR-1 bacterium RIFOXYB2_FULL_37_13]OGC32596.1 MAG: hypothetical protein A3J90_00430 [candidate division WOR-1 bacterium RIFOXYC2_FULL_37_10]